MPNWKTAQSKKQNARKTKLAIITFLIILGLVVLSQIFKFTQTLFSPWQTNSSQPRSYKWEANFNKNVVIHSDSISLLSYNPTLEKVTIINIPDETYLEVPHGFGSWQVRSIYSLGGDKLLKETLSSFLGVPIDGFINNARFEMLADKNPFSLFNILPKIKTDLTLLELINLKMGLSGVRFDKVDSLELKSLGLLEKSTLADGTEILVADPIRLDSLSTNFFESLIGSEHKTIAIFNSTLHPGLAQKAARMISNIGGDVIIVSNGAKTYENSFVTGEKSKTLDRLKQIFETSGMIEPKDEEIPSSRAQINVFLGEDYFNSL